MLTANNISKDYMEEWPLHYYEIEDISEREQALTTFLELHPDSLDDQKRLVLLHKRFGDQASNRGDRFMIQHNTALQILIIYCYTDVILNRKASKNTVSTAVFRNHSDSCIHCIYRFFDTDLFTMVSQTVRKVCILTSSISYTPLKILI